MLINFRVDLKTVNGEHTMVLPQFQNEFDKNLCNIGILYGKESEYEITNINCTLRKINNSLKDAKDIEEINFLAQILSYFYEDELKTFESIVSYLGGALSLEKLINIAYNFFDLDISHLNRLSNSDIDDLKSDSQINSKMNIINLEKKRVDMDYEKISNVKSIPNLFLVLENCYKENFCLDYDYGEDYILKLRLSTLNFDKSVEFSIPASENVINRALDRLGVNSLSDCFILRLSSWSFDEIKNVDWNKNIDELNNLVSKIKLITHHDILDYLKSVKCTKAIKSIDSLSIYTDLFQRVLSKSFY